MKKVAVFVSVEDAARVRRAIGETGLGRIGNYTESVFHALSNTAGKLRAMDEEKIEFACDDETYVRILKAIGSVAPMSAVDSWNVEPYLA